MFPLYPEKVLEVAMRKCTNATEKAGVAGEYSYCGYTVGGLDGDVFEKIRNSTDNEV